MRRKASKTKYPSQLSPKNGLEGRNEEENGRNEGCQSIGKLKQGQ
jgi:hypothetical protein